MSKLGILGWAGIVLMVIGYVLIPEYALSLMRQGYMNMVDAGGMASPSQLAGQTYKALDVGGYGPPIGMAGVVLVILSFARRLPAA